MIPGMWRDRPVFLFLVAVLEQLNSPVYMDVFTSIASVRKMLRNEKNLLNELRNNLPDDVKKQDDFLIFYQRKSQETDSRNMTEILKRLNHPNEAYLVIKYFARSYGSLRNMVVAEKTSSRKFKHLFSVAVKEDVDGSLLALLRLQDVYGFKTRDMIAGKYSHFSGPLLSAEDVFLLGDAAFRYKRYGQSVEWLEAATDLYSPPVTKVLPGTAVLNVSRAHIFGLLGRAFLRNGDRARARHIYKSWHPQDLDEAELKTLGLELDKNFPQTSNSTDHPIWDHFRVCATHGRESKKSPRPAQRCRYRGSLPYYRYREEVVSESPYISVIYDVVSDTESRTLRRLSLSQDVAINPKLIVYSTLRSVVCHCFLDDTSTFMSTHLLSAFLADSASPTVLTLSRRIGYITGLDTTVSPQGFLSSTQSSSEPLQVVNYGIGGYFGLHRDPFEFRNRITERILTFSGNRIASFLIYLSHVHMGGYTSFPDLDLFLRPIKNSALFWYNYSPSGQEEVGTWHQGCPVVVGDKWIANKWILSYGNTFVRRCGLRKEATQDDIEEDMLRGYRRTKKNKKKKRKNVDLLLPNDCGMLYENVVRDNIMYEVHAIWIKSSCILVLDDKSDPAMFQR